MDGSLPTKYWHKCIYLRKFADLPADGKATIYVKVLQKLDEEVAAAMVAGNNGVLTKLTQQQADYIGAPAEGPFKP